MNKLIMQYAERFNGISTRERFLIMMTVLIAISFVWWYWFAGPLKSKTSALQQRNQGLSSELLVLQTSINGIQQRIKEGVHKREQQRLKVLDGELKRVNDLLKQKTLELIEPEEMFELMQTLVFAESNLKLTSLKRKLVKPAFTSDQLQADQPEIYRHVMEVSFEGGYEDVLNYITGLEKIEWKLIWDKITLSSGEYPVIKVAIEISTLSDSQHWVGL